MAGEGQGPEPGWGRWQLAWPRSVKGLLNIPVCCPLAVDSLLKRQSGAHGEGFAEAGKWPTACEVQVDSKAKATRPVWLQRT